MTQNGIINSASLNILKSWNVAKTTIPLGFRELSASAATSGYDVDELVQLLIAAGFAPDFSKLKKDGSHYVYTEDIHTAIKAFQAFHGISPTGELNAATITKLKAER